MSDRAPQPPTLPTSSISLHDVYYVLFRYKWLLLGFTVAAVVMAAFVYLAVPVPYVSEARLLVRYVMDTRSMAPVEKDPQIKSVESRGETIVNSEVEILTSFDLAEEVAAAVGP